MHLNIAEPLLLHPSPRLASCLKQSPNNRMRSAGADLNKPKSLHHPIYRAVRSIQTPRTTPHSPLNLWSSIQPTLTSYLFTIPPIHQSPRHVVLYARAAHVHALPSGPVLWVIQAALVRCAYARMAAARRAPSSRLKGSPPRSLRLGRGGVLQNYIGHAVCSHALYVIGRYTPCSAVFSWAFDETR
jgi:hypothetical protein